MVNMSRITNLISDTCRTISYKVSSLTKSDVVSSKPVLKELPEADHFVYDFDDYWYNFFAKDTMVEVGLHNNVKLTKMFAMTDMPRDYLKMETLANNVKQIGDKKVVEDILTYFNFDANAKREAGAFESILNIVAESPELYNKVSRLKDLNWFMLESYLKMFKNANGDLKISDDIFESYVKMSELNPDSYSKFGLRSINNFLNSDIADEKLVADFIAKLSESNVKNSSWGRVFLNVNDLNISYFRKVVENGAFNNKTLLKLEIYKDLKDVGKIQDNKFFNEIYEGIFAPIYKSLISHYAKTPEEAFLIARGLVQQSINEPELYKYIKDCGVLDLVKNGLVKNDSIISLSGSEKYLSEFLDDIKLLKSGKNLIKSFDSLDDVLKKTTSGDVISVKGKMYINNNGKLESWDMTEEQFNRLFPLADRFATAQSFGDCYFISTMNTLYQNPRTRGAYYKLFKQVGDDIVVTIPAYKDYGGVVKFPKGEIITDIKNQHTVNGSRHIQMLEQAYSRVAFRKGDKIPNHKDPLTTPDLAYLSSRITGGKNIDVVNDFSIGIPYKGSRRYHYVILKDKTPPADVITQFANNPRYLILYGGQGHAMAVRSFDAERNIVKFTDPTCPAMIKEVSLKDWCDNVANIDLVRIS
ncbi:MAG: hypothetical protein E7Z87_04175 [Cyanobacteria bacterium SIG26]|nr:hypothetical protein [Cyanobacteria bacterium SIG26]